MSTAQVVVVSNPPLQDVGSYFLQLQSLTDSPSLLRKYLTEEVFEEIKDRKTPLGGRLVDIIQSGVENPDSGIGVYAADAASYRTFAPLFEPIILFYHNLQPGISQPPTLFGDPDSLVDLDPQNKHIISTRVRCGRSFAGYPFNSLLSESEYREIESSMKNVFQDFSGDIKGEYESLSDMSKLKQSQLIDEHILFKEGDRFLEAANACRYWPHGRGIFCNEAHTLIVWVNEEDHLRIISMQKGGNLPMIYQRFIRAVQAIDSKVKFARDEKLGYLTFCPTNIGTGIRASVHIKLPHLSKNEKRLKEVAENCRMQVRGTRGEHSDVEDAVFDISNKRRCGLTEFEVLKEFQNGVLEVIRAEELEAEVETSKPRI